MQLFYHDLVLLHVIGHMMEVLRVRIKIVVLNVPLIISIQIVHVLQCNSTQEQHLRLLIQIQQL